jgi:RNA polymerase sigma-70 factor (ECF subfamily)
LEAIYREHFAFVYRKAARLGGPGIDAEDAAQEVFMVVARRLHTYDPTTSQLTTWLYGITLNVVRGLRRHARVRRLFAQSHPPQGDAHVRSVDRLEVLEAHRIAYEVLERLSPKKRDVFILHELEGLECEEIGRIVGAKTETVWSRLHHARKEFSHHLARRKGRSR